MGYQNPYDKLINLFFSNVKDVSSGIQERGKEQFAADQQAQQYAQQEKMAQEGRDFQAQQAQLQVEQNRTDAATNYREKQVSNLQSLLPFIEPTDPLYQDFNSAIHALGQPLAKTGMDALNHALSGQVQVPEGRLSPNGQPVQYKTMDVNQLIALGQQKKQAYTSKENAANAYMQSAASYLTDKSKTAEEKVAYLNDAVLNSDLLSDPQKQAVLAEAKITDPQAVKDALLNHNIKVTDYLLAQKQLEAADVTLARQKLGLQSDKQLLPVKYEQAQQDLANSRQQHEATAQSMQQQAAQDFQSTGLIPVDQATKENVARSFGYLDANGNPDVAAMEKDGRAKYALLQHKDQVGAELQDQALKLGDQNINLNRIKILTAHWQEQLAHGQLLTQTADLANAAFAAAANGDKSTLKLLEGKAETDPEAAQVLSGIDWNFLNEEADKVLGDQESKRQYEKDSRAAQLQAANTQQYASREQLIQNVGSRFMYSDNVPAPNGGPSQLSQDIQTFVDGVSPIELKNLYPNLVPAPDKDGHVDYSVARARFKDELQQEAYFQRAGKDMQAAQASITLIANSAPGTVPEGSPLTDAQKTWLDNFESAAQAAFGGTVDGHALGLGILDAQNHQYYLDKLRADQLQAATEASRTQDKVNQKQLEALKNGDPVTFNHQRYADTLAGLQARSSNLRALINSSVCTLQVTAGALGGVTGSAETRFNDQNPDCVGYRNDLADVTNQLDNLTRARSEGENYVVPAQKAPDAGSQTYYTNPATGKGYTKSEFGSELIAFTGAYPWANRIYEQFKAAKANGDQKQQDSLNKQLMSELDKYLEDPAGYHPPDWSPPKPGAATSIGELARDLAQNPDWQQMVMAAAALPADQRASYFDKHSDEIERKFGAYGARLRNLLPGQQHPAADTQTLRMLFNQSLNAVGAPTNTGGPTQPAPPAR